MIGRRAAAVSAATLLVALSLALPACGPEGSTDPNAEGTSVLDSASWWIDTYGDASAGDPQVERAIQIFERLREESDTRTDLAVVGRAGAPYAVALPEGHVVLTRDALDLCYRGVPAETGDARLAFVLAHELTHLSRGHFWHAQAFAAMLRSEGAEETPGDLLKYLDRNADDVRRDELQADEGGAVLLTLAGYDPADLLDGGQEFFEEWVTSITGRLADDDPEHPTPGERAAFLRNRLAEVAERVPLFDEGVRLYEQGRFEQAIERLEEFSRIFPGPAVLNNLALAHFQLAVAELEPCAPEVVLRYRLPTVIDPHTLAERTRKRGPTSGSERSSRCFDNAVYRKHMEAAIDHLDDVVERNPGYLLARLNLFAALMLDEEYAAALLQADDASELHPDDPRTANARAVAHAAYMEELGATDLAELTRFIREARDRYPDDPTLAYNHAAVLTRAGRLDEARPIWERLLELEPVSPWASVARERLTGEAHDPPPVTSSQRSEALSRSSGRSSSSR